MIVSAKVERFRGIPRLETTGFGRVNLIIGKNDCGKTALLEALEIVDAVETAPGLLWGQQQRRDEDASPPDLERFWKPIFWKHNVKEGIALSAQMADGTNVRVKVQEAAPGPIVLTGQAPEVGPPRLSRRRPHMIPVTVRRGLLVQKSWALNVTMMPVSGQESIFTITSTDDGVRLPALPGEGSTWVTTSASIGENEIRSFSNLKQAARESEIVELLREIDSNVTGLELLAPSGANAEIFVRMAQDFPPLPITMMGDGFQRCLEMGLAAAADDWPTLFVDEFDNGVHHSALEKVWHWVATMSVRRNMQVFASTHSEECIHAACSAFTALNDDGLRVIRLDRHDDCTTAAVYDRQLVQMAAEAGIEIRG